MAQTSPSAFGASATATLAFNDTGDLIVATQKKDDFIGAVIAPMTGLFNGGATVGVGMGHTIGEVAMLGLAMVAENKFNLVDKVLPSGS